VKLVQILIEDLFMKAAMNRKDKINILLALAGIALVFVYAYCGDTCSYLKGSIFGIDLKYMGVLFMGSVIALSLLRLREYRLLLLSAGVGAEVFLIGFQVQNDVFCPYCFSFGAVLLLLFAMNLDWSKRRLIAVCAVLGLLLFAVFFDGSVMPAFAEEPLQPSFGNGRIHVRIYSDYFCNPCSKLDPEIAATVANLVKKNVIRVTFVDTPVHQHTTLYARYFLYSLNEKKEIDYANKVRNALFQAAAQNISDREQLEAYLKKNGIKYKVYDPSASFNILSGYLAEDKVRSTPTAVIIDSGRKQVVKGPANIAKAIGELK
jgi:thiol:disulfide interchange protein DsbA